MPTFLTKSTKTITRKSFPVVIDFYQAAFEIDQKCGGNFKP